MLEYLVLNVLFQLAKPRIILFQSLAVTCNDVVHVVQIKEICTYFANEILRKKTALFQILEDVFMHDFSPSLHQNCVVTLFNALLFVKGSHPAAYLPPFFAVNDAIEMLLLLLVVAKITVFVTAITN